MQMCINQSIHSWNLFTNLFTNRTICSWTPPPLHPSYRVYESTDHFLDHPITIHSSRQQITRPCLAAGSNCPLPAMSEIKITLSANNSFDKHVLFSPSRHSFITIYSIGTSGFCLVSILSAHLSRLKFFLKQMFLFDFENKQSIYPVRLELSYKEGAVIP